MLSRVTAKNVGDVFFETHCRLLVNCVLITKSKCISIVF